MSEFDLKISKWSFRDLTLSLDEYLFEFSSQLDSLQFVISIQVLIIYAW